MVPSCLLKKPSSGLSGLTLTAGGSQCLFQKILFHLVIQQGTKGGNLPPENRGHHLTSADFTDFYPKWGHTKMD